jgi:hypothetical protein
LVSSSLGIIVVDHLERLPSTTASLTPEGLETIVPARNLYLCHSYADHEGSNKDIYNCLKKINLFTAIAIIKDIVFNSKSYN